LTPESVPIETARMVAAMFSGFNLSAEKAIGVVSAQAKCPVALAERAVRVVWPQWFTVVESPRIVKHRSKVFTYTTHENLMHRWIGGRSYADELHCFKRCWKAIVNTCQTLQRDGIDYTVDWSGLKAEMPFVIIEGYGVNTYRYPVAKPSRLGHGKPLSSAEINARWKGGTPEGKEFELELHRLAKEREESRKGSKNDTGSTE